MFTNKQGITRLSIVGWKLEDDGSRQISLPMKDLQDDVNRIWKVLACFKKNTFGEAQK